MPDKEKRDPVSDEVIGAAIDVHRELGPGLLEATYEECLCYELSKRNVPFERQVSLPVRYKNVLLNCKYRMDLVVDKNLVVEIKAVDKLMKLHEAQLLTYLKLSGHKKGLLLNFNSRLLKFGIKRMVL